VLALSKVEDTCQGKITVAGGRKGVVTLDLMYDGQIVGNFDETRYLFDTADVNPKDQKLSLYEIQLSAQKYIYFHSDLEY